MGRLALNWAACTPVRRVQHWSRGHCDNRLRSAPRYNLCKFPLALFGRLKVWKLQKSLMSTIAKRRRNGRSPTRLNATVVLNDGLQRVPALISDFSPSGARIELKESLPRGETFYLLFERSIEPCRVAWQRGLSVGVHFVQATQDGTS